MGTLEGRVCDAFFTNEEVPLVMRVPLFLLVRVRILPSADPCFEFAAFHLHSLIDCLDAGRVDTLLPEFMCLMARIFRPCHFELSFPENPCGMMDI